MSDVRSDPRTPRLLDAVPGVAESLSDAFAALAHQAQDVSGGLSGAQKAKDWTGQAADQYRSSVRHLPLRFQEVSQAYGAAAPALNTYASELAPAKAKFVGLLSQLDQAEAALTSAHQQLATARAAMPPLSAMTGSSVNGGALLFGGSTAPQSSGSVTPAAELAAAQAVQAASSAVGRAQDEVNSLQGQCYGVLNHVDSVRGTAASAISNAYWDVPAADVDGSHLFLSALKQAGGVVPTIPAQGPLGYAETVGAAGGRIPSDLQNAHDSDGSAESIAQLSGDAGTLAGSLAFASAAGKAIGLGGDLLSAVGTGAAYAGTAAEGAKTGADIDQLADGDGDPAALGQDLAYLAAGGVTVPGAGSQGGIKFPGTKALNEEVEDLQSEVDQATDPAQKAAFEALLASAQQQAATVGAVNSSLSKIIGQQIGAAGGAADPHPKP